MIMPADCYIFVQFNLKTCVFDSLIPTYIYLVNYSEITIYTFEYIDIKIIM